MALPLGVGINYEQWDIFFVGSFDAHDIARNNIGNLRHLSLSGMANALNAIATTLGDTPRTVDQLRVAYEKPHDGNVVALERAVLLLGGSKVGIGMGLPSTRSEGRPQPISDSELTML